MRECRFHTFAKTNTYHPCFDIRFLKMNKDWHKIVTTFFSLLLSIVYQILSLSFLLSPYFLYILSLISLLSMKKWLLFSKFIYFSTIDTRNLILIVVWVFWIEECQILFLFFLILLKSSENRKFAGDVAGLNDSDSSPRLSICLSAL